MSVKGDRQKEVLFFRDLSFLYSRDKLLSMQTFQNYIYIAQSLADLTQDIIFTFARGARTELQVNLLSAVTREPRFLHNTFSSVPLRV